MSDIDIDYLHGIVRYILGKTTDEGKAVLAAADALEAKDKRIAELERAVDLEKTLHLDLIGEQQERIAEKEKDDE